MPTVRYQIKNEYGLADPALYGAADKEDPEALLEGVAMAGLVGVLRQLGDLAEFAAEIFHELHEEVMATSSRGHGLLLRVQQLEAEFPAIENDLFNQKEKSELNDSAGTDWHPNLQIDQNMVTREDMPRFILDCYEESRGPPRLFLLDKFDSAEDGACLKRYSDPSFFKTKFASTENMEANFHRERKSHKNKKKVLRLKNGIKAEIQTPLLMENKLENLASEKVSESQQSNRLRLKRRQWNHNINFGRSYVENILGPHISSNSVGDSPEKIKAFSSIESSPPVREIIMDVPNVRQVFEEKSLPESLVKEVETPLPTQKTDNKELPEEESGEVEKSLPSFPVNDLYKREVNGSARSKSSSSLNDYRTDDIASELENYLDALATMESEVETDNEARTKLVQNTYIKEYPNSSLNESKIYSGEFSILADEKPPHNLSESLASGCSSEVPPFTVMNQDIAADEFIETDLVNKRIMRKTSENESSIVLVQDQVIESAGADPDAFPNGIKRGETTDVYSDHGIKHQVSSEMHALETNMMSTDVAEKLKLNEKIVDDDPSVRSGDPNIDGFDSPGDCSCLKPQTHDGPQETLNEDPEDDKDLLLTFPNKENPEEQQGSISQASSKKSAPLTPVDDRSSTGSTEGLFEAKESYFSSSERFEHARSSSCSEVAGDSSGNDDTTAENSRNFTESETTVSGVLSPDSFVSNPVNLTPNDSILESSEEQKPLDTACILESSSVSNSGYHDLVFQAGPLEIAEEKLQPNNGGKPTLSLNPFLHDSMLSDGQNQIGMSVSKILMGGNDQQLSESHVCQWQTNQADDDVVHKPINQTDDKLWSDASPQDLEAEENFLRSSETSNFDSTKVDEAHEPIDQMDKKLPIIVSSHDLNIKDKFLGSSETSDFDSSNDDEIHELIDQMDKKLPIIVSLHDLKIKDKFLRSSETSDFDSSNDDEVHEPTDQMDKKLLISVPSQDLEMEERAQSSEISNFDSTKDVMVHEPINQMDKKLSIVVSSQDLETEERLQSSEISNFDSTNDDVVHESIDQTDKKLLTIVSPQVLETEERVLQSSETSNFDSTKDDEVYKPIDQMDKQHLTIASPLDLETEERLPQSSETSSFESIKVDENNARNLEVNKADSSQLCSQLAPSLSAVLLSREEFEAEAAFLSKQVPAFLSVHETSEISLQEKSEKEDKTLERAGSTILSPESTRDLLQATGSTNTQDSERILSNTEVQYPRQSGIEILESSKIPNTFLPLDNKEIHVLDEDPPPPPLPPIQWRMGKFRPNSIPSIGGMKSTPPSADNFCSSPLMWEPQLLPSNSFQDIQIASFVPSHEHQKIEVRQDALIKEAFESDANYMHQLPITISHPKTSSMLVSMSPEPSNPFLSPASTEPERMPQDRIIDGYFSDTLLSTEAVPQGLLSYQGFYMYASEDEPFTREEYQKPVRRPSSLLNRPRDPLIEAVASHDKSTLRRVSELARTSPKSEGERNNPFLEQIRNKSFNLKPAAVTKPIMKAPPTNLKVAAILEKANAIRQAVAGSDEDEDGDSWSDS